MTLDAARPAARPVRASTVEVLRGDPGSVISLLADPEHTDGALTANRPLLRRGSAGAPPHLHQRSAELFYVLDGALDVLISDEITTLHPGDLLVPAGVPHAFAPTSDSDADLLVVYPRHRPVRLLPTAGPPAPRPGHAPGRHRLPGALRQPLRHQRYLAAPSAVGAGCAVSRSSSGTTRAHGQG